MSDNDSKVTHKLQLWRSKLLDLSRANRLLYFRPTKSSSIHIHYPTPEELFLQLVVRGKTLTFPESAEQDLFDLEHNDDETASGAAYTYKAGEIGPILLNSNLSRALYNLRTKSRLTISEQGVNVLYLIFGMLQWYESIGGEPVQSPLVMVPVALNREALRKPYSLTMFEDDILLNPTLAYKLEHDFAIQLPELNEELEESGLSSFLERIQKAVGTQPKWRVVLETHLAMFSFQNINLYKDLEIHQEHFVNHPLIQALCGIGEPPQPANIVSSDQLDDRIPPSSVFQVVDADSSQQEAIEAAKLGVSFVLQGPPGTGKSQTITNIIAEFLAAGKRVLFVSAKMAALEVVQRRLNEAGLGEFCLQLHNHKRDKREVVSELVQPLEAPIVQLRPDYQAMLIELESTRKALNEYVRALHAPRFDLHLSVFQAYGEITRLAVCRRGIYDSVPTDKSMSVLVEAAMSGVTLSTNMQHFRLNQLPHLPASS